LERQILEAGLTLDQCLDHIPTVTRKEALRMLEFFQAALLKPGRSA